MDPWLKPTPEVENTVDHEGLESLLSAIEAEDAVPDHNIRPPAPLETCSTSFDTDEDVRLETEVVDANGTISTISQAVSKDQVRQAQRIIANAINKGEQYRKAAIYEAIQLLYPYSPRDGQRDALHHLVYRKKDLILIAKTSFGKSMILQAVSILQDKKTSIVILPLDQIGKEQADYIKQIGGRPCFLNADNISGTLLKEISDSKYTHILMSPELAVSDRLRTAILSPRFKDQLALVVVDEAHLVQQWGIKFRTDYARLNLLRSILGRQVPWFACSATLDSATLHGVVQGIGFDTDIKIQRTSIDRPELLIRTGLIPKMTRGKYSALRFICDPSPLSISTDGSKVKPSQIPKTIVFFDSKREVHAAHETLMDYLQKHENYRYSKRQALEIVQVFTRDTHEKDKTHIIAELQTPGTMSSIRVVLATEALGIGVNLPDIQRVVLYGLPKSQYVAVLWQRGGRASRNGQDGEIIILADEWILGDRAPSTRKKKTTRADLDNEDIFEDPDQDDNSRNDSTKQKSSLSTPERRLRLPDFWYNLVNDSNQCIRKMILDYFSEPVEYRDGIRKERCCSNCNPNYSLGKLDDARYYLYSERGGRDGALQKAIAQDLLHWAEDQYRPVYQHVVWRASADCFLSPNQRTRLAKEAREIFNLDDLQKALGPWDHFNTHGEALLSRIKTSRLKAPTSRRSRPQQMIPQSQMSEISPASQLAFLQPTLPSDLETLSHPLPDLSMSIQGISTTTNAPLEPKIPTTSLNIINKRRPLGSISGNSTPKRRRRAKEVNMATGALSK